MFCKNFKSQIKKLLGTFDNAVMKILPVAIHAVTVIRLGLNSPVADLINRLIPGEKDDMLRFKVLRAMSTAVNVLTSVETVVKEQDPAKKLALFLEELKKYNVIKRDAMFFKLSSLVTATLHGNEKSDSDYDTYAQVYYKLNK